VYRIPQDIEGLSSLSTKNNTLNIIKVGEILGDVILNDSSLLLEEIEVTRLGPVGQLLRELEPLSSLPYQQTTWTIQHDRQNVIKLKRVQA